MVFLFRMFFFFFFNDTATTEIYTLSLHDALPISTVLGDPAPPRGVLSLLINALAFISHARSHVGAANNPWHSATRSDRKSTRLNSSHLVISYAVFCLKKKNNVSMSAAPAVMWLDA